MFDSINRNIVECKVASFILACFSASVLIETLWNVKMLRVWQSRSILVLIETLWNVKSTTENPLK